MPIRFRCAYCNQLMGIARRKAGQVVKCPKCAGEIIVPVPEDMASSPGAPEQPGSDGAFDDPNFDLGADGRAMAAADKPAQPAPVPPPTPGRKRVGVFLSLGSLAISIVVVILLLILTFVLGLYIGKQSATPAEQQEAAVRV